MSKSIATVIILMTCSLVSSLFAQTSITFTFANGQITGTAPQYFEFDVMAQAGALGTNIGDNQVYLNYNALAFGSNIATNIKINVLKGTLLQGPFYTIVNIVDTASARVGIASDWLLDGNNFGNALPTTPTQLIHVKIEIADPSENSGLSFEQSLMVGQQYEDQGNPQFPNPLYIYSPVIASDTYDSPLPVELTSFVATFSERGARLIWKTKSEIDNLGFEVWRSTEENDKYHLLSSYEHNPDLEGHGTTPIQHKYIFLDDQVVNEQTYWYKLYAVDYSGNRTEHGPVSVTADFGSLTLISPNFPENYHLYQNFPNPFNPSTTIQFDIPNLKGETLNAALIVYNTLGQKVRNLYSGEMSSGSYQIQWDGKNENGVRVPNGVYLYRIQTEDFVKTKKMIVMR